MLLHRSTCFYSAAVFLSRLSTARAHGCTCQAHFSGLSGAPLVSPFPFPFVCCRTSPHGPLFPSLFPVPPHASPAPARRVRGAGPPPAPPSAYLFLTATPRPLPPIGCPRLAPRLPPRGTRLPPHWPLPRPHLHDASRTNGRPLPT